MKKITITMLLVLLLVTGCGTKQLDYDISFAKGVSEEIMDIQIGDTKEFETLNYINDNTLESVLGINRNFVDEYAIVMSLYGYSDMVAIINNKNKNVDKAKLGIELYIEAGLESFKENSEDNLEMKERYENVLREEYKDYSIYIISSDNTKVLEEVKKIIKKYT